MALTQPPSQSMVDYRALATIVAGGLITSTFFTLWVVPLAYTVFDDLANNLGKAIAWAARTGPTKQNDPGVGDPDEVTWDDPLGGAAPAGQ